MAVSDRQVHSSNHEAIHAALHDALFVYGHEVLLNSAVQLPAHVYTTH